MVRIVYSMLRKDHIRLVSTLVAAITSMPFISGMAGGIYVWFSPNVMLASAIALRSVVLFNLLGVVVMVLCLYRKRWFCNMLCPTGWCCQQFSQIAYRKRPDRIPVHTGKVIAIFTVSSATFGYPLLLWIDPLVIFNSFCTVFQFKDLSMSLILALSVFPVVLFSQWLLPHSWCSKVCPLGGMQEILWQLRSVFQKRDTGTVQQYRITRREVLASFSGLVAGGFLSATKTNPNQTILPPASLDTPQFETVCLRCWNCVRACPAHIIQRNTHPTNWYAWMTPMIDFTEGYCLSDCTICGTVCPSGAISPFTVPAKKILPIGKALIDTENCLLQIPEECGHCKNVCVYNAIKITAIPEDTKALPLLDRIRCVGCGACAQICPEGVIRIMKSKR